MLFRSAKSLASVWREGPAPCHAEHIRYAQCKFCETSRRPKRQTLRGAQGDNVEKQGETLCAAGEPLRMNTAREGRRHSYGMREECEVLRNFLP